MMKKVILYTLGVLLLVNCQKERLVVSEEEQRNSLLADSELRNLLQGVASHDGSHDDIIDESECFSINYPYGITINGVKHNVYSISDLSTIELEDLVTPSYPIFITLANYFEIEIYNDIEFQSIKQQCASGQLFNNGIRCVDLVYPISVAVYDTESVSFQTVIFDHDRKTFESIVSFDEGTIVTINYPIEVIITNSQSVTISSNQGLKDEILDALLECN